MSHPRKLIRQEVARRLLGTPQSRPTAAGERVYPSRVIPLDGRGEDPRLPAILVYTKRETVDRNYVSQWALKRILELAVEVAVVGDAGLDDALDDLCERIEELVAREPTLGGNAVGAVLSETEIDFEGEGDRPAGAARLTFEVTYFTDVPAPTRLDDFARFHAKYDMADPNRAGPPAPDGQVDAVDDVMLPTQ